MTKTPKNFKDSQEYAIRRMVRAAIKKSEMTKSDRDITLAIVNLWYHHGSGKLGPIHPGRTKLAKRASVSIKTVSRCLGKLKVSGIIYDIENSHGEGQKPTKYLVNIHALCVFCGATWIDDFLRYSNPKCPTTLYKNVPPLAGQNVPQYNTTSKASFNKTNFTYKQNCLKDPSQRKDTHGVDHE